MKVLLTGGSGFIGRYVLEALQSKDIDVVNIGRSPMPSSVKSIEIDMLAVNDFVPMMEEVHATHLLHLAWEAEPGKYWASPLNTRWTEATIRLVEAFCITGGRQVVLAGTCAEYDWSYGYLREDFTSIKPNTLYGTAKDAMRRLAIAVCNEFKVPCSCGRVFFPFGHGEAPSRLIPSLIDVLMDRRKPFAINATVYRDFMHAHDVAEGFVKLLLSTAHGAYNISSGEPTRLREVVIRLADLVNADPNPILSISNERPKDPLLLVGENLKLKSLGWSPSLNLEQGLVRVLEERPK